jgi:tetratricopeptide (TPR) repeat protein
MQSSHNRRRSFIIFFIFIIFCNRSVYSQINLDYWMNLGIEKIVKKQYVAAIDDFNFILRFKTDLDDAYYFRAISKFNLGDYRGAIEDYTTAIGIKPYSSSYYSNFFLYRGNAKARLYDFKGAMDDYNQAIDVTPGNQEAYISRGLLSIIMKKYEVAIADLNKTIDLNRNNSYAYLYRAIAKQCQGFHMDAMKDFNRALQLNASNPEILVKRGINKADIKDFKGAIDDYDRAIRIDADYSLAYFERAIAQSELLDYKSAMRDYDKVIELDPDNDLTYYNRADLKAKVGDFKSAIEDYTRVIKINPNNVFTYFNRAIMWQRLNSFRKAIDDYSAAIRLYPEFATAFYNRSIARNSIHDFAGAATDYNTATRLNASLKDLNQSGKIDSTGLAKLTEFKADFSEGNMEGDKGIKQGIVPFPNFVVSFVKKTSEDTLVVQNEKILDLNTENRTAGKFIITTSDEHLIKEKADSLAQNLTGSMTSVNDIPKLFARAIIKDNFQNYNGSLEDYNQIISLKPNFALAYFNRANTRYTIVSLLNSLNNYNDVIYVNDDKSNKTSHPSKIVNQNFDEAIADYNKCIQLDPAFSYAYFDLANIRIFSKDYPAAITDFSKAIELDAKFAEAYYNRGLTYIYIQEKEKGCYDLSKAGELGIKRAYETIKKFCN